MTTNLHLVSHPKAVNTGAKATCPFCPESMLKRTLRRHLRTVHRNLAQTREQNATASYACSECSETFARKDNFDRHQLERHGAKVGLVECVACGAYVRERTLDVHFKTAKCRQAQHESDSAQLAGAIQSMTASLGKPGRFDSSTAIDTFYATLIFTKTMRSYLCDSKEIRKGAGLRAYFASRGLLMRVVFRGLDTPDAIESRLLVLALSALMVPGFFSSVREPSVWYTRVELLEVLRTGLRVDSALVAIGRENLVLAGAINALQTRLHRPLIVLKPIALPSSVMSEWPVFKSFEPSGVPELDLAYGNFRPTFDPFSGREEERN